MKFPLEITSKLLSIRTRLYVRDDDRKLMFYVRQKFLAVRENVQVYFDEDQRQLAFNIRSKQILDFNANYEITRASGERVGVLRRQGARSIWRASYEISDGNIVVATITEDNPWAKLIDSIIGEIPIIGMIIQLLLNPRYTVKDTEGNEWFRVIKRASVFERKFRIENLSGDISAQKASLAVPAILMMILLEGSRG